MPTALVHTREVIADALDWGSTAWAISGKAGNSAALTLGRVVIRAGCSNPPHRHGNCEEILYLLAGELDHFADDIGWVRMAPGDAICIPPGVTHHATCRSEGDAEMVVVYSSPSREFEAVR
jgi:quercetin dioxygenase-like cupin family protein